MGIKKIVQFFGVTLVSAVVLAGCGGGDAGASATPTVGVDGENLAYDKTTMSVPAGQAVTLTFTNGSASQQHNWVLVADDQVQAIDDAAAANGGEVPAGTDGVLAAGGLLDAGGSEQVGFTVPAGTYTYICTVPGHYAAGMAGVLTAQ